jgi:glutaminyl-tRNA synthetase
VDSQSEEQIRAGRGTVTTPGTPSPDRDRSPEENLALLRRMRAGEFPDGSYVLRAKIDLAHPNMIMRDPLLLRIRHAHHYRQGDAWCLYPLYDFAHGLSDAIEGITRSLCTLEFKDNRDIYDWLVREAGFEAPPTQIEFARLELDYTVLSKRKLLRLVNEGHVAGWDDPRMPTMAGLRRRGVRPEAIRAFADAAGVTRNTQRVEIGMFEHAIRHDLNMLVPRVLCVVKPLKVVLTNFPEGEVDWLDASYYPHDVPLTGSRKVPFTRELYIEREDFMEDPPKKFFRLAPGREVRLRYGYFITCQEVVKDAAGEVVELRCTYDPATRGGDAPDGRKVQGTIHWVSASHGVPCEVRLYDRLFAQPDPDDVPDDQDFLSALNPQSLVRETGAVVEPSVAADAADTRYQFERVGYFWRDPEDSRPEALVFNRIVGLRDSWAKEVKRG